MTKPGVTHYGYYIMSFQFVYVGNGNVRNTLIVFALFSAIAAVALFVTSCILLKALRKEIEKDMVPWLYAAGIFFAWRTIAIIFASVVNDMIFGYHIAMCLFWVAFILLGALGWVIVYSLYLELSDLTKLEDLAHLRMGTMSSLNMTQSIAGSRPTTPHSTVSTAQVVWFLWVRSQKFFFRPKTFHSVHYIVFRGISFSFLNDFLAIIQVV